MLFTAPDGWDYSLGWGITCSTIGKIICEKCPESRMEEEVKKKINPNHQMLFTAPDGWGINCSTIGKITLWKMPSVQNGRTGKKIVKNALSPEWENRSEKINPNHQMLFTGPDSWGYFWAVA